MLVALWLLPRSAYRVSWYRGVGQFGNPPRSGDEEMGGSNPPTPTLVVLERSRFGGVAER